jgi:hypothetical protein
VMKEVAVTAVALALAQAVTPQSAVDELLDADRAFARAAAATTVIPALTAMFGVDVVMPTMTPAPGFARGRSQAAAALKANPVNAEARLDWTPLRGGVSADGQHGFTVGYMTLTDKSGRPQPLKYVAYWTKGPQGWRVAAYRRTLADQPPPSRAMLAPALPAAIVPPTTDATELARYKTSLEAAEKAFSDEAQSIGLGAAFAKHGSADAVNIGPRDAAAFVVGAEAIGKSVGAGTEGQPSPVSWAADEGVLVASSGDLGVTFGFIRRNAAPAPGQPAAVPFFTIWRRASPSGPWRYVAE